MHNRIPRRPLVSNTMLAFLLICAITAGSIALTVYTGYRILVEAVKVGVKESGACR